MGSPTSSPASGPASSVVEAVVQPLVAGILDGTYPAGARLPAERELAARLGVARVTVRAALRRLIEWGVVTTRQGSGAVVRPRREWTADALAPALTHALASGDLASLLLLARDGLELRRSLVLDLVGRAAGRVARGALDGARAVVRAAWAKRGDARAFVPLDRELLPHVLEAAGMWPSLWLINSLAPSYLAAVGGITQHLAVPAPYEHAHLTMLDAIEAGDGPRARAVFGAYLDELDRALVASQPAELVAHLFPDGAPSRPRTARTPASPKPGSPTPSSKKKKRRGP